MREVHVDSNGIQDEVRDLIVEGHRLMSMYVEEGKDSKQLLNIILSNGKFDVRMVSEVNGSYPSLTSLVPSACYEREILEMSGVEPMGHPEPSPLRLRYDARGVNPMRKDVSPNQSLIRELDPMPHNGMDGDGIFEVPVGPIHAGVIEPNHFRFSVAGETILMMRVNLGYKHKGIEKLMEAPLERDGTFLMERVSGDNGIAHSLAYLQAIERDTQVPERASYIRMILAELERICSHVGGISGIATDVALSVPAASGMALRERLMRLNQDVFGSRFLRGMLRPGGIRRDVDSKDIDRISSEMVSVVKEIEGIADILRRSPSFMDRVQSIGMLSEDDAMALGVVGPIGRASGITCDVRHQRPYELYENVGLKVPSRDKGDVYSRFMVKMDEALESVSMIMRCIGFIDEGPICTELNPIDGFSMGVVESPRGEIVHCLNVVEGDVWRYKIRDASFMNWPAIEFATLGYILADFPLINKSLDLSCSGNDI